MKSTVADYQTRVYCVRVEAVDGSIFRFASYPHDLTMSNGAVYRSDLGYEPTDMVMETTARGSIFDLAGFFDAAGISRDQLNAGVLDGARVYAFATSWATPVEDEEELLLAFFGKAHIRDGKYAIECMGALDALTQSVGNTFGPLCTHILFDETLDGDIISTDRSRCTGPRSAPDGPVLADYKETGTITSVTSAKVFADSSRAEAVGYFDYGSIKFTSGDNAGLRSIKIKKHTASGTIELYHAPHYAVQVGDSYEMVPGCDHQRLGDCFTKFNNCKNCNGNDYMAPPEAYKEFGSNG